MKDRTYEVEWCLKMAAEAKDVNERANYEELAQLWSNK